MPGSDAAKAIKPKQPASLHNMTDAMLADEHRGQSFAKRRVDERLAAIEAELDRRGLAQAKSAVSLVERTDTQLGRVDLKRLRAERPEICREFAQPGSFAFWNSRTLRPEERV